MSRHQPTVLTIERTIRSIFVAILFLGVTYNLTGESRAQEESDSVPNIVFILADDLGWKDVGFNDNNFYQTPNIDRLAADGKIFTSAYSGGPNCAPTRACLMTGMYGPRTNIWQPKARSKGEFKRMKLLVPNRHNKLGDTFESLESLSPKMTSIAEVIKPSGYTSARFGKWHLGRDTQGFDESSWSGDLKNDYPSEGKGYSDIRNSITITDAGVRFIEANKERPFFLYLSHFEVHSPLKADPEVTEKYKKQIAALDGEQSWRPEYAAMIEALDNSVGRIRDKIEELGLSDNTLIIFSSDNGGVGGTTPLEPLRGVKGSLYEGGIRVPTCMCWPGKIKPGSTCDTAFTSVDFMPTLAELTKAELPTDQPVDGTSIVPLMLKEETLPERAIFWHYPLYLSGNNPFQKVIPITGTDRLYWRAKPCSVIRRGDWKLIHSLDDNRVELFNIAADISEQKNLSEAKSQKAATLLAELNQWRQDTNAPMPSQINSKFTTEQRPH